MQADRTSEKGPEPFAPDFDYVFEYAFSVGQMEDERMDNYWLRHVMAAYIASEEIKGHSTRPDDPTMADDRLRRQFSAVIENAYCIADLMIEIGDKRLMSRQ